MRYDIRPGCQVYARRGAYIGIVEAVDDHLMRIRMPLPEGSIYYVPTSAVIGVLPGSREVFLACSRDELPLKGWLHPPHGADPQEQVVRHLR